MDTIPPPLWFVPKTLGLRRLPYQNATDMSKGDHVFLFNHNCSQVFSGESALQQPVTSDVTFVYVTKQPQTESDPSQAFSKSIFLSVLHQWHSASQRFACVRGALAQSIKSCFPFQPLLESIDTLHTCPNFSDVLQMAPWKRYIIEDFLVSYARQILPAIISDDCLSLKLNLVVAKLIQDGTALLDTTSSPTATLAPSGTAGSDVSATVASPESPAAVTTIGIADVHQTLPEVRTMEDIAAMEAGLFSMNIAWEFNFTAKEVLDPFSSEHTLVIVTPDDGTYICAAVDSLSDNKVYIPLVPGLSADTISKMQQGISQFSVDSSTLRDLDVSCLQEQAQARDSRITQVDMIVVDCSGSMDSLAFSAAVDRDMKRRDASQVLFNMLVDKYRALEISAEVGCILFGSRIVTACDFTSDLTQFETLLGRADNMGGTELWRAIETAAQQLSARRRALVAAGRCTPDCRFRILAVTDGEDSGSREAAARTCRAESVILDAFVLGTVDDCMLRGLAHSTGGHTLEFRALQDATELFEQAFVVDLSARAPTEGLPPVQPLSQFEDLQRYPRVSAKAALDMGRAAAEASVRAAARAAQAPVSISGATVGGSSSGSAQQSGASSSSTVRSAASSRRLLADIAELEANAARLGVVAMGTSDPTTVALLLQGRAGSLLSEAFFVVVLSVSADYPFRGPQLRFASTLFHPQIAGERMCIDSSWSPSNRLSSFVDSLHASLESPDLSSSINSWASSLYQSERPAYLEQVRQAVALLTLPAAQSARSDWRDTSAPRAAATATTP